MKTKNKIANDRYLELIQQFPLISIKTKADADKATMVLDRLVGHEGKDTGHDAYVNALTDLLEVYESEHEPEVDAKISGVEMLREMIEQHDMKQLTLAKRLGISAPAVSLILSGARAITVDHARALGKIFSTEWTLFL